MVPDDLGQPIGAERSRAFARLRISSLPTRLVAVVFAAAIASVLADGAIDAVFSPELETTRSAFGINLGIVLACGALALAGAIAIVQPLRALSEMADRIARGETDLEVAELSNRDEVGVCARALRELLVRARRNQLELQRKQEQIERVNAELTRTRDDLARTQELLDQVASSDGLTRLPNHRYFQDRLRIEAKRADRSREALALLLIDLDDFKSLNDRFGHAAGDEVLRRVATILGHEARETDLLARYGGDQFALLAPRTDAKTAAVLAERMRQAIGETHFHGLAPQAQEALAITASVGIALYRSDVARFGNEAHRALQQAKREGKDHTVLFPFPGLVAHREAH